MNHVTYKPALVSIGVGAGVLERKGCSSSLIEAGFLGWLRMCVWDPGLVLLERSRWSQARSGCARGEVALAIYFWGSERALRCSAGMSIPRGYSTMRMLSLPRKPQNQDSMVR